MSATGEVLVYPTAALRQLVEETARDESISPAARERELEFLEEEARGLHSFISQKRADARRVREALESPELRTARENADIREELLDRDLSSPERLDDLGYVSHDVLDERLEAAGLREGVLGRARSAIGRKYEETKHRRGRGGKWVDMPDHPDVGKTVAGGGKVKRVLSTADGPLRVYETPNVRSGELADAQRGVGLHPGLSPRARAQLGRLRHGQDPRKRHAQPTRQQQADEAGVEPGDLPKGLDSATREGVRDAEYGRRRDRLGKRVDTALGKANEAEGATKADVNPAGKISQHRLLEVVHEAASNPTTAELHGTRGDDGTITWDPDRAAMHETIVNLLLRRRREDENGDPALDPEGEPFPSQEQPEVFFLGGGYAAGKSSVRKSGQVETPDDPFVLDPDEIKALLPEFDTTMEGDPEANLRVYEESWAIAQQAMEVGQAQKMNMIVDGISDTSSDEMLDRVQTFRDAGYTARAVYVDIPTADAQGRARHRAETSTDPADKRHIPDLIMRAVHRDVAGTIRDIVDNPRREELGLDVEVYDNAGARGAAPTQVYDTKAEGGVVHQDLWDRLGEKAQENIEKVEEPVDENALPEGRRRNPYGYAPQRGASAAFSKPIAEARYNPTQHLRDRRGRWRDMPDPPQASGAVGHPGAIPTGAASPSLMARQAVEAVQPTPGFATVQPWNNVEALYERAPDALHALKELLDLGHGLSTRLNADVHLPDKPFDDTRRDVAENPGRPHVIIADNKDRDAARVKVEEKYENDASMLCDVVRATVAVARGDRLPGALNELGHELRQRGWEVSESEQTLYPPSANGYGDMKVMLVSPEGQGERMRVELQIHLTPLWLAKDGPPSHLPESSTIAQLLASDVVPDKTKDKFREGRAINGHALYEAWRRLSYLNWRTREQDALMDALEREMEALYRPALARAWGHAE